MNDLVVVTSVDRPSEETQAGPSTRHDVSACGSQSWLEPVPSPDVLTGPGAAWLESRWIVLGLLALTGPIGLPALWLSRRFSRAAKIAGTTVFVLATVVLPLVVAWYLCDVKLRPLVDALSTAARTR
jgi:hypothetical protein